MKYQCLCHQYWKIIPDHRKVNPTRSLTNMQSSTAWVATVTTLPFLDQITILCGQRADANFAERGSIQFQVSVELASLVTFFCSGCGQSTAGIQNSTDMQACTCYQSGELGHRQTEQHLCRKLCNLSRAASTALVSKRSASGGSAMLHMSRHCAFCSLMQRW